jgi:eukaryotic-like serine/threonine-protein kinase
MNSSETNLTGQKISNFDLGTLLLTSSTGQTYQATLRDTGQMLAVKVLDVNLEFDPGFAGRFPKELNKLQALKHPHIAKVLTGGGIEGYACLILEELPELSARALLQRFAKTGQAIPLLQALEIARQTSDALEYAHEAGVLHGELKPDVMLLETRTASGETHEVKVVDFGLVEMGAGPGLSAEGLSAGAPAYIAPEQWQGINIDGRSDIYALGIVLYELATGLRPFDAKTLEEAVSHHLYSEPRPPRSVRPELPEEFDAIVLRCLKKNPEDRYANAGELSSAIRAFQERLIPSGPRPTVVLPALRPGLPPREVPVPPGRSNFPRVQILERSGRVIGVYEVGPDGITLGRLTSNDVSLEDETVSRHHARLELEGTRVTVTDLSSSNGTFLEGDRLQGMRPYVLSWGSFLAVGGFWLKLEPPSPPERSRVGVSLERSDLTLEAGRPAVLRITLANLGVLVDHLKVVVDGVPETWVVAPDSIKLNPGTHVPAVLTVNVPRLSDATAGARDVIVKVMSLENPGEYGTANAIWTVLPYHALSLGMRPSKANGRAGAVYESWLRNDGNATALYMLEAEDDERNLKYDFQPTSIKLEPGQVASSKLQLRAKRRVIGTTLNRNFQVKAQAVGPGDARSVPVQFAHQALLPVWFPPLMLALLGGLGFWLWGLIARPPEIADFSFPSKSKIIVGQGFRVQWQARNANRYTLKLNDVPIAELDGTNNSYKVPGQRDPGKLTLVASNRFAQREQTLEVKPQPNPDKSPIVNFKAIPNVITAGQTVTVYWNVLNAQQIKIDNIDGGGTVDPRGQLSERPEQSKTYRLTAINGKRIVNRDLQITVKKAQANAPKILNFSVQPSSYTRGQVKVLQVSWQTSGASSISLGGIGEVPANGTRTVPAPPVPTDFQLVVRNTTSEQPVFAAAHVDVIEPPKPPPVVIVPPKPAIAQPPTVVIPPPAPAAQVKIVEFSLEPNQVQAGQFATLKWQVENASIISISGFGKVAPVGQKQYKPTSSGPVILIVRNKRGKELARADVQVQVNYPDPLIEAFTITPLQVQAGQPVTITWATQNASSVKLEPIQKKIKVNGSFTEKPKVTRAYTLRVTGLNGKVFEQSQTVTVTPAPIAIAKSPITVVKPVTPNPPPVKAPNIDKFSASDNSITVGKPVTLSWRVRNADSVNIEPLGPVAASGVRVERPNSSVTYKLIATNAGGRSEETVTVKVSVAPVTPTPKPSIEKFAISDPEIELGKSVTLTWKTSNAQTVTLEPIGKSLEANGSLKLDPQKTTTYRLVASSPSGTADESLTVKVTARPEAIAVKPPDPATPPASLPATVKLDGQWSHNFGDLSIKQNGNQIVGFFHDGFRSANGDKERINLSGIISGNKITGTYQLEGVRKTFEWTVDPSGNSFEGTDNGSRRWCAAKRGTALPDGCSFSGTWLTIVGGQECPVTFKITLTRLEEIVEGTTGCVGTFKGERYFGQNGETIVTGTLASGARIRFQMTGLDAPQFQGRRDSAEEWCGWRSNSGKPAVCLLPQ